MITVVIREKSNRVVFTLSMSKHGGGQKKDFEAYQDWLTALMKCYERDPRPVVVIHPYTGNVAVISDGGRCLTEGVMIDLDQLS